MGSNFGATLLDVTQGMELAKQTQRRDEEWTRGQKRADMQDQVAQYGLEDLQRTRGDAARERSAVAGSDGTVKGAADAAAAARIAGGNVEGAAKAKAIKTEDAIRDFQLAQTEFMSKILPQQQKLQQTQLEGQLRRQPGLDTLADQDLAEKSQATQERMLARAWQVANVDKAAAVRMLSDSPVLFQGKKIADILKSKDGQRLAFLGEDGKPIAGQDGQPFMVNVGYLDQLATKYGDPGKVYEVEAGKRLVHTTATGKAKEIYAAPAADVAGKFVETKDGGILDTRKGTVTPAAGGPRPPDATKRDARVKTADSIVRESLGGSLNMGLPSEDAQKAYPMIMERVGKKIDAGIPPEKAARDAMEEVKREAKLDGAAPAGPVNWQDFINRPFPTPRDAKPAGPNLGGSVMNGYGLDSATPEVPSVFP